MTAAQPQTVLDSPRSYEELMALYGDMDSLGLLDAMINQEFKDRIALVSSFGAESIVLLDLVAQVNPATPVIFIHTQKLFGETVRYRDKVAEQLGLTNIVTVKPDPVDVANEDKNGLLWTRDTDACCDLRKVRPLARAMNEYDAWITGRKRFQSTTRNAIPLIEKDGSKIKINPLAHWNQDELDQIIVQKGLPKHPLVDQGYPSIGCMPCTSPVEAGQDRRMGRWAGQGKTECGIHIAENI
ncbi:phosphoadenylyl-sulfate reductase [Paremcibacter congregatus]|uniref:Adenosine 5'-phosphosulfate reductase n=1 Tax=Paremcibacter congregatus TaxID=2043170 RepID=A0A2G4YV83_9PROT|nr:phosphoadenylyl-sulfate reductase [Paremcibacter congregatus]PHZ86239.1 phosphoadenylyl-sulfate reductase [Paremcibacter congregatus]QDE27205.1 phosphoadenylyl-sulfate reductase [Paremcibacter congregatus]